jgi:hypothetical protein
LGQSGRRGEELEDELVGFVALAAGCFKEAAQNAVVLQAVFRAGAEDRKKPP